MKNKILTLIAFAAAFASCNKEAVAPAPVESGQKLVITATIGNPDTRIYYEENESNGYTGLFGGDETLQICFVGSDDAVLSTGSLSVNRYSISDDGKTAKFETTDLVIPEGTSKILSYLATGSDNTYASDTATVDLKLQDKISTAQSKHILYGSVNMADVKDSGDGTKIAKIAYSYKTSLLRFTLTFPDQDPSTSDQTSIKLTCSGNTVHNVLRFKRGEIIDASEAGDIIFYPSVIDTIGDNRIAIATICVSAADNFKDCRLVVNRKGDLYSVDLNLKKETLEAGKVYDVKRSLEAYAEPVEAWVGDEAGSADYVSASESVSADWLTAAGGKVSWTANETGAPRSAKLFFSNGTSYAVTQISSADFKGDYDVTSKIFSANASMVTAGSPATRSGIVFGTPLKGETLADVDAKSYTNQIGVSGLYSSAVMDACVDIDYDAKTVRVGLFLDARDNAQAVDNGVSGYGYACFLPGMGTTVGTSLWTKPWNFVQPDLSKDAATDYTWLWFTVSDDFKTLNYNPNTAETIQYLNTSAATESKAICGITVAVSASEKVDAANVRSSWDAVYQGNLFDSNNGVTFKRK